MAVQVRPGIKDSAAAAATIAKGARSIYCESKTDFRYARTLGMPLRLLVSDGAGRAVLQEDIYPGSCPRGTTAR